MKKDRKFVITAIVFLLLSRGVSPSHAQEAQKETTIHAKFHLFFHRLTPSEAQATVVNEVTITMSGHGDIRESYDEAGGSSTRHGDSNQALGVGYWKAVNAHKLVRSYKNPQNTDIITVTVKGNTCQADWRSVLLPGYTDYTFVSLYLQTYQHFSEARMVDSECDIKTN
jgi:hypothetical protein